MILGKVKWFSQEKGYGFITSDTGIDYFFNVQSVKGATLPSTGDFVSFEPKYGNKGLKAINVTIKENSTPKISEKNDDRVNCPSCAKKIVPRIIIYHGKPAYSVCPYCAKTVSDFRKEGCFIATAVYGDENCHELCELRKFRDEKLLTNLAGKLFVATYYSFSPPIANWLKNHKKIAAVTKLLLDNLVKHISKR